MRGISRIGAAATLCAGSVLWAQPVGDARRGHKLFESEQCVQCHSINGKGGTTGPDLTRHIDRGYTPATMASIMWNHAPDMWKGMKMQGIVRATLSPESAADLFAYFVSARYFEKPGDAGRGKQLFASKHCAECHGIENPKLAAAPPVAKWESLADPLALAQQMWNHGPRMRAAFAEKHLKLAPLTGQELSDILVYLQNLPETKNVTREFQMPAQGAGAALFESKGCTACHAARFHRVFHNESLTDIAAAMWDHQGSMKQQELTPAEMRDLIGYVWSQQYFGGEGSAARGKKVFADKNCAVCHNDPASGAPSLAKGKNAYSDLSMVSVLWEHGPRMLDRMNEKKLAWPRFTAAQMTDLIAYLNSL